MNGCIIPATCTVVNVVVKYFHERCGSFASQTQKRYAASFGAAREPPDSTSGGSRLAFELNRIDGSSALSALLPENFAVHDNEAMIDLQLTADHDIGLSFPAPDGVVEPVWLELAADVLVHLKEIDNEVQRESAKQWARTTHPSSHYEGKLAYLSLEGPNQVVLRYWVIGCNSEWDERFIRTRDGWVRVE